jgi:transcription initiation factor TFIIF subunit beta
MLLRNDVAQHQNLPKEYNMDVTEKAVKNTFVFTEQDLPSYAAKNKERAAAIAKGIPAQLLRQQQKPNENQPQQKGRRGQQYTRRAIPSQPSRVARCLDRLC